VGNDGEKIIHGGGRREEGGGRMKGSDGDGKGRRQGVMGKDGDKVWEC
jgi:hypothetical protein